MSSKLMYNKKNLKRSALISLLLIGLMSVGQLYVKEKRYEIPQVENTQDSSVKEIPYQKGSELENEVIVVHIVGEVQSPSIVKLPRGSRLFEAVEKAGGFTEKAEPQRINLAQVLVDGNQYVIPPKGKDLQVASMNEGTSEASSDKININTASEKELQSLSGIGEVLAGRIVTYRKQIGGYKDISQLLEVEGIGDAKYEEIKDRVVC